MQQATGVGTNEERIVGAFDIVADQGNVASLLANMVSVANTASTLQYSRVTANSAVEDLIDDYLGGSHQKPWMLSWSKTATH